MAAVGSKRRFEAVVLSEEDGKDPSTHVHITPLGAGSEVGRSCIVVQYQ